MTGVPRQRTTGVPGAARQRFAGTRSSLRTDHDERHQFFRRADNAELVASRLALARERGVVAKLQELDQIRDAFVSTISHELRTPLTSILGFLHLVMTDQGLLSEADRARMLGIVQASSQDLLVMVDDLLTLPQLEDGMAPLVREPVDLIDVLHAAHASFPGPQMARIEFEPPPGEGFPIIGDAGQLTRAFINLLANAIKFTPVDGSIQMKARRADDASSPSVPGDAAVVVSIRDTGIGIPKEEQDELFSRFFRSSVSQEHQTAGLGIGLAIASGIVRGHQGSVSIESAPGVGTTVRVRLRLRFS